MNLDEFYADVVAGRLAAASLRDGAEWPRMSTVLDRCTTRLLAVTAILGSDEMGPGWDKDVAVLTDIAIRWTALTDALGIVEREEAAT